MFILIDGDHVGERMDLLFLREDMVGLRRFGRRLNEAVDDIARLARSLGAAVHVAGGDCVLVRTRRVGPFLRAFDALRSRLPCAFTIGIGSGPREAFLALKVAKAERPSSAVRALVSGGALSFVAVGASVRRAGRGRRRGEGVTRIRLAGP